MIGQAKVTLRSAIKMAEVWVLVTWGYDKFTKMT